MTRGLPCSPYNSGSIPVRYWYDITEYSTCQRDHPTRPAHEAAANRRARLDPFVKSDDAGAAKSYVVLQAHARALHLAFSGASAQLPYEFGALSETGRAEWMPLREQAAGRIGDHAAAVSVVAIRDKLRSLPGSAQAEALIGEHLIVRKAVVKFDDIDVVGSHAGAAIDLIGGGGGYGLA